MKNRFSLTKVLTIISFASMVTFIGCGDEGDTNVSIQDPTVEREEAQGTFATQPMVVVNNRIENDVRARSTAEIDNDNVIITVQCQNVDPVVPHRQYVHTGTRCPTIEDDTNNDGYVDYVETQLVCGPTLLALDTNIASQNEDSFPQGSSYAWVGRSSLTEILAALPSGEDLSLQGRAVIIYGISPTESLPPTVATREGESANTLIPIACGLLQESGTTIGGQM